MKFLTTTILTALLAYVFCVFLPWWAAGIAAFVVALLVPQRPLIAFLAGFTGVFLLWYVLTFIISSANGHLLAQQVSKLILKSNAPQMLMLVGSLLGGLVAGFAAASAAWFRRAFASTVKN